MYKKYHPYSLYSLLPFLSRNKTNHREQEEATLLLPYSLRPSYLLCPLLLVGAPRIPEQRGDTRSKGNNTWRRRGRNGKDEEGKKRAGKEVHERGVVKGVALWPQDGVLEGVTSAGGGMEWCWGQDRWAGIDSTGVDWRCSCGVLHSTGISAMFLFSIVFVERHGAPSSFWKTHRDFPLLLHAPPAESLHKKRMPVTFPPQAWGGGHKGRQL
ncbi:hypothetical protein E2C01_099362 [Portunus trituberculatus]|uniref:Uncharacterized protein n=1 Tax=Portunus trituberculatus TaxID=210409 RepID=A0A5B7K5B2_PORTR|nr:hypothetical protein [Portunus trituberculatus]